MKREKYSIKNGKLMSERCISELKKVVIARLKNENVKIMLFGSRSRGNNYPYSDVDIGILPSDKFDERKLTLLRETVEIRLNRRNSYANHYHGR